MLLKIKAKTITAPSKGDTIGTATFDDVRNLVGTGYIWSASNFCNSQPIYQEKVSLLKSLVEFISLISLQEISKHKTTAFRYQRNGFYLLQISPSSKKCPSLHLMFLPKCGIINIKTYMRRDKPWKRLDYAYDDAALSGSVAPCFKADKKKGYDAAINMPSLSEATTARGYEKMQPLLQGLAVPALTAYMVYKSGRSRRPSKWDSLVDISICLN